MQHSDAAPEEPTFYQGRNIGFGRETWVPGSMVWIHQPASAVVVAGLVEGLRAIGRAHAAASAPTTQWLLTTEGGGLGFAWRKRPVPVACPDSGPVYRIRAEVASPPQPSPLTLAEFDAVVCRVVAEEAPLAKVVTDGNQDRLDAWISCAGVEERVTSSLKFAWPDTQKVFSRYEHAVEAGARAACREIITRLGRQVVGRKS